MHWSSALTLYVQPAKSAIGYLPIRAFWHIFLCEFVHSNTILQRELNICALWMSARTNLLTARASSRPLALKCLNWQSLHEFSLNTYISTCAVQVSSVRTHYQLPGDDGINAHIPAYDTRVEQEWMVCPLFFFHRCCCNVLGSQNAHPSTQAYISWTLFVLRVIYNKPYCRCVVRFKLNRSPSACRTVCGEPYGSIFFREPFHPYLLLFWACNISCCMNRHT